MSSFNAKSFGLDNGKDKKKKTAIITTAFQDHIIKQFDLTSLNGAKKLSTIKPVKIEGKSKINTGLYKKSNQASTKKAAEQAEKEFVIDEGHKPSEKTLAEKIGLVPTHEDEAKLNETDWSDIKQQYLKREELKEPCVICKEDLGSQQQILLSCSHTFHRKCLEAFERFSGRKSCPMCRKNQYHKRVIYDAAKHYKHTCAARIQAAWRGYLVKKWYRNYRKTVPPLNPALRKKFFQEKLTSITDRLVKSHNYESEALCIDVDKNIEESRQMLKNFEDRMKVIDEDKWLYLMKRAITRNTSECSICINKLEIPDTLISKIEQEERKTNSSKTVLKDLFRMVTYECKPISLLSCSHVFHHCCLKTFEELNFDRLHSCPECRMAYQKYELDCSFQGTFLTQQFANNGPMSSDLA